MVVTMWKTELMNQIIFIWTFSLMKPSYLKLKTIKQSPYRTFCEQTVETPIRRCIMQHLIWDCTVCPCFIKGMLGLYGLIYLTYIKKNTMLIWVWPNKKLLFLVTGLNILVRVSTHIFFILFLYFVFLEKNIILGILKGEMPFKMHKMIFFRQNAFQNA